VFSFFVELGLTGYVTGCEVVYGAWRRLFPAYSPVHPPGHQPGVQCAPCDIKLTASSRTPARLHRRRL